MPEKKEKKDWLKIRVQLSPNKTMPHELEELDVLADDAPSDEFMSFRFSYTDPVASWATNGS